ncbi:hypothetical protein [Candidatus Colwellia aromaticivorans]|uniref:hypothetical protein n=1 Tax=Candidatus Colwellia aromaticivorans TaxID=2267621 RepID=UPI000DF1F535|nr:hypothetical protein [Candidatus Colwellia aromaticivorans]
MHTIIQTQEVNSSGQAIDMACNIKIVCSGYEIYVIYGLTGTNLTANGDINSEVAAERLRTLMAELTITESGLCKHSNGEILPW